MALDIDIGRNILVRADCSNVYHPNHETSTYNVSIVLPKFTSLQSLETNTVNPKDNYKIMGNSLVFVGNSKGRALTILLGFGGVASKRVKTFWKHKVSILCWTIGWKGISNL